MIRDTHLGAASPCGEYPAASGFAAEPYRALLPDENARYLAAAAVFNACMQTAAGAPQSQCPPGSSFQGGESMGVWQGKCVSTFTGQPTTELITARAGSSSSAPPADSSSTAPMNMPPAPFGPRGTPPSLPARTVSPRPRGGIPDPPPRADPGGINYDLSPIGGHATAPGFLETLPSWAKWAAAGGALFLLFKK